MNSSGKCTLHQWNSGAVSAPQDGDCDHCEVAPWKSACDFDGRCKCFGNATLHGGFQCGDKMRSASLQKSKPCCL